MSLWTQLRSYKWKLTGQAVYICLVIFSKSYYKWRLTYIFKHNVLFKWISNKKKKKIKTCLFYYSITFITYCTLLDLCCCGSGLSGWESWRATSSWQCCRNKVGCCLKCRHCRRWSRRVTETAGRRSIAASGWAEK